MLALLALGCAPHVPPDLSPDQRVEYSTPDGWSAGVRHFPGDGPPVLLVHGMAANHYNWDYHSRVSLVRYLQERGWDVWVAELRGDPEAVAPTEAARLYSMDDHARLDLPAILDKIQAETGAPKVYWVGHSMGGILLYTALELYPERLAAGVAINSPAAMDDRDGLLALGRKFGWVTPEKGTLPVEGIGGATAWMGRANPLMGVLANRRNLDWPLANGLARNGLEVVPGPMQKQVMTWLDSGEILQVDGGPWFTRADRPSVPLMVTGGALDRIVPEANAAAACRIFPTCTYVSLSEDAGFAYDYGHVDPVLGKTAPLEVFPMVEQFLAGVRDAAEVAPVVDQVAPLVGSEAPLSAE